MPINNQVDEKIISGLKVKVLKKDIKNFHLNVLPPDGSVRVSVPKDTTDDTVHFFIASRLSWIQKKVNEFKNQPRETKREYVKGESHYFLGKRYLLDIVKDSKNYVEIEKKKYLLIHVKNTTDYELIQRTLEKYYREELKKILEKEIPRFEKKIGVKATNYTVRKMKTKWGSCNSDSIRINFNLYLAKKPIKSIRYVIVHELIHLMERSHNKDFIRLMDKHMPNWRNERKALNDLILSYEEW